MSFGAYTTTTADAAKDHLDHHLKLVEHHLDQIEKTVPQAGATTSRLNEAKTITQSVVYDLHDEIDRRTDEGGNGAERPPSSSASAVAPDPAGTSPLGAASTPTGGSNSSGGLPPARYVSGLTALSLYGFDYWDEPGAGGA